MATAAAKGVRGWVRRAWVAVVVKEMAILAVTGMAMVDVKEAASRARMEKVEDTAVGRWAGYARHEKQAAHVVSYCEAQSLP